MKRIRKALLAASTLSGIFLAGCGAAYYGTAIGIIATQDDDETDLSFPDAEPTSPTVPGFATLQLGASTISVSRTDSSGNPIVVTDYPITSIDFPPGYGEAKSNRDTGTSILDGDRLVVRINGDVAQAITFGAPDVASDGATVAAMIQAKVRALMPVGGGVPLEAYTLFTASYDGSSRCYTFRSGAPSAASAVAWEPAREFTNDAVSDATSDVTAARLGLGVDNGGIEIRGSQSVGVTVLNAGTDVAAPAIRLYLSKDKVLDTDDLLFDIVSGQGIAVGNSRRYYRENGAPATQLVRWDIADVALVGGNPVETPRSSNWYVIFDVAASGGETILDNNQAIARPIEVYQPLDEPLTGAVETADPLDFAISSTFTPIGLVTGEPLNSSLTLMNLGAAVTAPTSIPVDVILSTNTEFNEPAAYQDPMGVEPGVRINPTDPNRAIGVTLQTMTGVTGVDVALVGNDLTVTWDPASNLSVDQLITALNTDVDSMSLVVASHDGVGDPSVASSLDALFATLTSPTVLAQDVFLTSQTVNFPVSPERTEVAVTVPVVVPDQFATGVLPLKVFPLYRIRPPVQVADPDNPRNNVRQAANFTRLYDRLTAYFDPDGGLFLPTEDDADFAALDAVTQRPVNVDSITQGQQRTFRFQIPDTGLTQNESQVLILLTTETFDPHIDLLSSSGELLAQSDDSALGTSASIYTSLQANGSNRNFYLVVSSARVDESDLAGGTEAFALTVSVNVRQPADLALVNASGGGDVSRFTNQRYATGAPRVENNVLIPFTLNKGKAEVSFTLATRARVRVASRPAFAVSVQTVFSQFVPGGVASVNTQPVLGPGFDNVVYRPSGGSTDDYHILDAGVYTLAFESQAGTDDQLFRLEVETQFNNE